MSLPSDIKSHNTFGHEKSPFLSLKYDASFNFCKNRSLSKKSKEPVTFSTRAKLALFLRISYVVLLVRVRSVKIYKIICLQLKISNEGYVYVLPMLEDVLIIK